MASSVPDLSSFLKSDLYSAIIKDQLPWPRDQPLNWYDVSRYMFDDEWKRVDKPGGLRELWYPALKEISKVPVSELPKVDLMSYLPNPKSESFPEQAFALQVLFDQGPKILFGHDTIDRRYVMGYFEILNLKLVQEFWDLPEELRPWTRERWPGITFEYWTLVWIWFFAPLIHSESKANHMLNGRLTEELRVEIEKYSGKKDPHRKDKEALSKDTKAFAQIIRGGTPNAKDLKMEDFWWWMLTVLDVHSPIIYHFGRYPSVNGAIGRESTAEEIKYQEEVSHFGECSPEIAKEIKDDVKKGIWRPLGES